MSLRVCGTVCMVSSSKSNAKSKDPRVRVVALPDILISMTRLCFCRVIMLVDLFLTHEKCGFSDSNEALEELPCTYVYGVA